MNLEAQKRAPIYEALERFRKKRVVPFDVPGHKRGRGNPELASLLGEKCVGLDVNSMKPLDNLCHPVSVIREAEELAADAFGASHAFLMVGGTTSAVQGMILSVCKAGDKIILPRNVHKSAINALVLCGAVPVYVNPEVNSDLGISLGMDIQKVEKAIEENPDAVAVLVNNPTYYGICSDLRGIVKLAHEKGMKVLADEAHGTHLYFGKGLPVNAMEAGADMAAVSMHKSGGSLTQSSMLLLNKGMNPDYVRQIINLTQTTSASYLLLSSLDISRRNLALRGEESFGKVVQMAEYARNEINSINVDAVKFKMDDTNLKMTRPAFGGHLMATIICPRFRPCMSTVRPGVMKKAAFDQAKADACEIEMYQAELAQDRLRTKVVEVVKETRKMVDLIGADIVVSVGRGISKDVNKGIELAEQLAEALGGGVVGASRAVTDEGWMTSDHQVGQTGKTVHPRIYVSLGISGAIQHKAGMQDSELIIAVDVNDTAPIFEVADYGIVGDLFEVVPMMIDAVKAAREGK